MGMKAVWLPEVVCPSLGEALSPVVTLGHRMWKGPSDEERSAGSSPPSLPSGFLSFNPYSNSSFFLLSYFLSLFIC